jgi:hypothetical protein
MAKAGGELVESWAGTMLYNVSQSYTPALELHEFTDRSLIVDTETVGKGAEAEVVEIALGDCEGNIVYHSLVRLTFNRLPRSMKEQRSDSSEFEGAPWRRSARATGSVLTSWAGGAPCSW